MTGEWIADCVIFALGLALGLVIGFVVGYDSK